MFMLFLHSWGTVDSRNGTRRMHLCQAQ
jgi:hypothetical protein